jgi:hypothetical protein
MDEAKKDKFRKEFIKMFADVIAGERSGVDALQRAYIELAISQCMDAAIFHREKLDLGIDEGFVLKGK